MEAMAMTPDFWNGKRVLITGHTGFKGSWLALWLSSLGARATGVALSPPTTPNMFEAAHVAEDVEHILVDVRDYNQLRRVAADCRPEIVFHLAAQPLVRYSYEHPLETLSVNVIGTANVLQAVRGIDSSRVLVIVTSDKCYEDQGWVWGYRETDQLGGHDPYAASKACAELVTSSYRRAFFGQTGVAVASARAGNVVGGGDWAADRLVPDLMAAFAAGRIAIVRNPTAVRPWQHVLEPLDGYLTLAERLWTDGTRLASAWNFGPDAESVQPVSVVANRAAELWGGTAAWKALEPSGEQPRETRFLRLDCAKARNLLEWSPCWSLDDALIAATSWYRAYAEGQDVRALTMTQISEYLAARARLLQTRRRSADRREA